MGKVMSQSPRRLRAKYTRRTNLRFMLWVFRPSREQLSGNGHKFINGAAISTIHKKMSGKEGGGLWRDIRLFG